MARDIFLGLYLLVFLHVSYFSFLNILRSGFPHSVLMKGIFSFLTVTNVVPVEMELVPGFDLLSLPHFFLSFRSKEHDKAQVST